MNMRLRYEEVRPKLRRSRFRSRFALDAGDLDYLSRQGMEKIASHAADFIRKRLAPARPVRDGKQTPFKGHPVFKAQHATAACCRGCLSKWYGIPEGRALTEAECSAVVEILLAWIGEEARRRTGHNKLFDKAGDNRQFADVFI